MNDTPYTLDELKRRIQALGLDHIVSSVEFDESDPESLQVSINLQLFKPVKHLDMSANVRGDTPEERFNRAMTLLDA